MPGITIVGLEGWDERSLRIVGCTLAEQFLGHTISCDPNMNLAGKVGLIDGTELFSPFVEFEKTVLIWYVWYTAENGVT
jgi:hypothetical protein